MSFFSTDIKRLNNNILTENFLLANEAHVHVIKRRSTDYCNLSPEHLLCNYNNEVAPECVSETVILNELTDEQKQYLIDRHNTIRRNIAQGNEGNFPAASNMMEMVSYFYDLISP